LFSERNKEVLNIKRYERRHYAVLVYENNSIVPDSGLDDGREVSGGVPQRFGASFYRHRFHWEINRSVGDRCLRAERDPSD